jgi:hypothetical protein
MAPPLKRVENYLVYFLQDTYKTPTFFLQENKRHFLLQTSRFLMKALGRLESGILADER